MPRLQTKNSSSSSSAFACHNAQLHPFLPLPLPLPLRVRSAHCFSEAAKLLIKAFAFYIWRTRTHTHAHAHAVHTGMPLYISYIHIYIVYGRLPPVRAFWPQSRRKLCNKNASLLLFLLRLPGDALRMPRNAVKRFEPNHRLTSPRPPSAPRPLAAYPAHRECVRN